MYRILLYLYATVPWPYILDDAKLPYGVLAGNHDVMSYTEGELADYTSFSQYFGQSRYSAQPWYGESYQDNRGHYDLISVDGIDFIMAYLDWEITQDGIDWLNTVLQQYPERKAILNFHEYLLVSGGIGEELQKVYNQVVAANPNVCMV
jgi:3',5'-cyclic AMP phosphodiesterase CpdA